MKNMPSGILFTDFPAHLALTRADEPQRATTRLICHNPVHGTSEGVHPCGRDGLLSRNLIHAQSE